MSTRWQEGNPHAVRQLDEPCPFCRKKTKYLWHDPTRQNRVMVYRVRCFTCEAAGPWCDCGEGSAVPMWLSVAPNPALLSRVKTLEAAMKPFAKFADQFDSGAWQDHEDHWCHPKVGPTVGDLRRARAALAGKE